MNTLQELNATVHRPMTLCSCGVLRGDRLLARSNAQLIVAPEPLKSDSPAYDDDDLLLSSLYIDINVLSVSPDVVLVNDACPELARILEHSRVQVVPARHRHRCIFIGGAIALLWTRSAKTGRRITSTSIGDKRNRLLRKAAARKPIALGA